MHANWQSPYPLDGLKLAPFAPVDGAVGETDAAAVARRSGKRDRFDYWLIFAVCLLVFVWVGLIERCNPLYWRSRREAARGSLWSLSKRSAHHCTKLALQG